MYNYHVVNLHFTDKCNYNCVYCFSKKYKEPNELTFKNWCEIINNINNFYKLNDIKNGRINLVGGEPLLNKNIMKMAEYVKANAMLPSIITNGSLLNKKFILSFKDIMKIIGISVDSLSKKTNSFIDRITKQGKTLNYEQLVHNCKLIKKYGIVLKINVVVSKLNYKEDFSQFFDEICPDRIKFMQVYINKTVNDKALQYVPTSEEFEEFTNRHKNYNPVIEDNDNMDSAYLMVDSQGYLISNANNNYVKIGNCLDEDFMELVKRCNIDANKFKLRYK